MNNTQKNDAFGMPIDESERSRAQSSLKSFNRLLVERDRLTDTVKACKRSLDDASAQLENAKKDRPAALNAEKEARKYADEALKTASDPRVVLKNRAILVIWVIAFGFTMITETFGKAFPGMYVPREYSIYICNILANGIIGFGALMYLLNTVAAGKKYNILAYFYYPLAIIGVAALPTALFIGTIATSPDGIFPMTSNEIIAHSLPSLLVTAAVLLAAAALDIPLSKLKPSKSQIKAYDDAYAAEYKRILKENSVGNAEYDKSTKEAKNRVDSVSAKLAKAEAELSKTIASIDAYDAIPEFYKDRTTVSQFMSFLEIGTAGSLLTAAQLFEQWRAQMVFVEYQNALADAAKAEAEYDEWQKTRTKYTYESKDRAAEIARIRMQIERNRTEANDIYRSLGKDKRV